MASSASLATLLGSPAEAERATHDGARTAGMMVFSGNANRALATAIAARLGVPLRNADVGRFADGETAIQVNENVRGRDVYVVQPTCPPVNDHFMELALLVGTLRRASAKRITVVMPYFGYARQDRKMTARVPISAADVARMLEAMGPDRVIAVDLHCGQIQGFFGPRTPVDNLYAAPVGVAYFAGKGLTRPVVVSPDAGGVFRAKQFREGLNRLLLAAGAAGPDADAGLAMIIKQRAKAGQVERVDLVGEVAGCDAIIVDDLIDTARTLCAGAALLVASGARRVFAFASHGLFSGPALQLIDASQLAEVVVTDTVPLRPAGAEGLGRKVVQLSVATLVAEAMRRVALHQSVSDLFVPQAAQAPLPVRHEPEEHEFRAEAEGADAAAGAGEDEGQERVRAAHAARRARIVIFEE
jgi:ribose-phosphate pyrophosphokinase